MEDILLTPTSLISAGWNTRAMKDFLPCPIVIEERLGYRRMVTRHFYRAEDVMIALHEPECRAYFAALQIKREKQKPTLAVEIDLLDAIREASASAHRSRDRAECNFMCGFHGRAGTASQLKRYYYRLKERGIVAAHRQGLLRYAGASPQGMAVYEYGDGGMACFHSTLHPVGVERKSIEGHPEVLKVQARRQKHRLCDVEKTLEALEVAFDISGNCVGYERSAAPKTERLDQAA